MDADMYPGTAKAVKAGCTCPAEENNHGEGAHVATREKGSIFAVDKDCSMHGFRG